MDFDQVRSILRDLPPAFKRPGTPYMQWEAAWAAGLFRYALGLDGTTAMVNFNQAKYGWLDLWGLLFGIERRSGEPDRKYRARILYTLSTRTGTPEAIRLWILNVWGITATVKERFPAVGYEVVLPASLSAAQAMAILRSLVYVRPAGIPFFASFSNVGLYLNTINFLNAPKVTGAYLTGGVNITLSDLPVTTNNVRPLLPDLYLTDTVLNPSLAAQT